jgi:hypothetical protein
MRGTTFLALLMLAVQLATAADRKDPSLTIRGVGLGSSPAQIMKALGKPVKEVKLAADSEMGMGQLMELFYAGLKFELCKPDGRDEFHTWQLTVTGPAWLVNPGIQVGMTRDQVLRVLASPSSAGKDETPESETLHYGFVSFDGWYWVSLANGKVSEIGAAEDWS